MDDPIESGDPAWDETLALALTPEEIMHSVFHSADNVHTAWESCVDRRLIVSEITALADADESYCRMVEQEYVEDEQPELTWHDWTVELKLGMVYVSAHWRAAVNANPSDWHWCASESETAFTVACVLVGKRVRRGIVIEDSPRALRKPRQHH